MRPRVPFHKLSGSQPAFIAGLAGIAAGALLIQGYHLGVDDAGIYLPAIKKAADPALFPFGAEFFSSHAQLSFFPDLVGNFARLTRMPVDFTIFLCHALGIFLLLIAAWRLACCCFETNRARWAGVATLAVALGIPVAGTALFIADPYVTARTLSTPATLFAIASFAAHRRAHACAWLLLTALVHPQMSVYCAAFLLFMAVSGRVAASKPEYTTVAAALPLLFDLQPSRGAAREALLSRTFFWVSKWEWYEWIGVFAPLGILWWLSCVKPRGTTAAFRRLTRALVPFGLVSTAAALVLTFPQRLENLTRLQPMRGFHLIYVVFFVLLGGLIGEYALGKRPLRWAALFFPLSLTMWFVARQTYPASAHIEWPNARDDNAWVSAFLWIRHNTPKDAIFALDPGYMRRSDMHGFRAVAERSALADEVKDSGAVSMFPALADNWKRQVQAQTGLDRFGISDFETLAKEYGVGWAVTRAPLDGLVCPFRNGEVAVCRIPAR